MKDKKHGLSTFKEEDKLVLHNVIGGLEEMEYVNNTYDGPISIGHNQLCNREVEVDEDWMRTMETALKRFNEIVDSLECECDEYNGFTCSIHNDRILAEKAIKDLKAISQGKVIKVKE